MKVAPLRPPTQQASSTLPGIHFHCGGFQHQAPRTSGWDTGWRVLPYTLLETPEAGRWHLDTAGARITISPGQVLILPAGIRHRLLAECSQPMVSTWFYAHWEIDGVPLRVEQEALCMVDTAMVEAVLGIAQAMQRGWGELSTRIYLQKEGIALLEPIGRHCALECVVDERVARAMTYVKEHLADPLDRAILALVAGLSETRFHDVFVSATGEAPIQYLHRMRLQRAMALLSHTEEPISRIAEQCGFTTLYYFSRFFHKHTGCAPSVFRNRKSQ
ncbi:MAG: AraC family transcriptional regulator [Verrucomicrobiota bacterium]|nr:AraC family transcriptional regulator [Verrucomicrobiota bacterium]